MKTSLLAWLLSTTLIATLAGSPIARATPAGHSNSDQDALILRGGGNQATYRLSGFLGRLKTVTVTVDDPVYGRSMTYDGFDLTDLLKLLGQPSGEEVVFTARDGYAPSVPLSALQTHRAILAYQEHGTPRAFPKVAQGKAMVSPAPYYLVWTEGKKLDAAFPWPYQLVQIEVVSLAEKYDKIYPREAGAQSGTMKGFMVFKDQCIRCHSLNLQGGDLGPELNVPKNVTEYWDPGTLKAFIRNVGSFRAKDKMPPFTSLSDEDLSHVIEYLAYMKGHKTGP